MGRLTFPTRLPRADQAALDGFRLKPAPASVTCLGRLPERKGRAMEMLIWGGVVVSLIGLAGLIWCIATVWKARKAGQGDDALRDTMRRVVPMNTGALFLSVLGLMIVVLGIVLG